MSQQSQAQDPRHQVTIQAALDTLCSMFESVDRDVIHMILIEGCGGNMESAVEALLAMTGGVPQSQQQPSKQQQQQKQKQAQTSKSSQQQSSVNLADDFLRPPSYFLAKYENDHEFDAESASQRQIIEDEMFAK